jgi:hypothetical protein
MGDGYCRHCDDEVHAIRVERDFLVTLLCHIEQDILSHLQGSLEEDIEDNCDFCDGERSRQLLNLVWKAKAVSRSQHPRIVISIF